MALFAHIESGFCVDVHWDVDEAAYQKRFADDALAGFKIVECPDGTLPGANGTTFVNPTSATVPLPGPLNPNNPFFGKAIVPGGQFLGVILGTLGFVRANRLMNDSHFTAAKAFLTAQSVLVNPDDRQGQFLGLVQYVTTTNGDDGAVLVTAQEIAGIRAAMK